MLRVAAAMVLARRAPFELRGGGWHRPRRRCEHLARRGAAACRERARPSICWVTAGLPRGSAPCGRRGERRFATRRLLARRPRRRDDSASRRSGATPPRPPPPTPTSSSSSGRTRRARGAGRRCCIFLGCGWRTTRRGAVRRALRRTYRQLGGGRLLRRRRFRRRVARQGVSGGEIRLQHAAAAAVADVARLPRRGLGARLPRRRVKSLALHNDDATVACWVIQRDKRRRRRANSSRSGCSSPT